MFRDEEAVRGPILERFQTPDAEHGVTVRLIAGPVATYVHERGKRPRPRQQSDSYLSLVDEYVVETRDGYRLFYCQGNLRIACFRAESLFCALNGRGLIKGDYMTIRRLGETKWRVEFRKREAR